MASYYANFARNGDPNGPGLPAWPLYDPAAPERIVFSADGANAGPLPLERLRFIDTHRQAGPWCPDVR